MIRIALFAAASAAALVAPALAETIVITGGTVATGDGSAPIAGGTVVIRDGRVVAAGRGVAVPAGARVIDAAGKWVTPGIVAGYSDVGLVGVSGVEQTNDAAARRSPFSAALDIAPAIDPVSPPIAIDRRAGVTRAIVAPDASGAIFAGQGAIIDLGADMDAVTKPRAFQFVEFGEEASRIAGGSRTAIYASFRNALSEAAAYARNPAGFDGNSKDALLTRADAEALVPVMRGAEPLMVHVEKASDILAVLSLHREFPALKMVLVGVTEGWTVAPQLAASKLPVIAGALTDLPESFEQVAATQSNVGRMEKAGVRVSFSAIDGSEENKGTRLAQDAGNLVGLAKVPGATGLDWGTAFAMITSRPADAIGMGGQIGVLKPGAHADVVIWDGDPLELSSAPVAMWIDGVAQPLVTRQTRLRDRYMTPSPAELPKAYDR